MSASPHTLPASATTPWSILWSRLTAAPGLLTSVACVVGGALLVVSSLIHLHLWDTGYRHIPTIGPLFLLQGIAGVVLAVIIAVWRRAVAALVGALFAVGTLAGLVVSVQVGLFGFKDSFSAPFATVTLVIESIAFLVLVGATFLGLHDAAPGRSPSNGAQS